LGGDIECRVYAFGPIIYPMRFAVTLDDDVAAMLKLEMKRSGESFKQVANRILRVAFNAPKTLSREESEVTAVRRQAKGRRI